MDESLFQRISPCHLEACLRVVAVATPVAGLLAGLAAGVRRRRLARSVARGLLWGAAGPLLLCAWHLVGARTHLPDRLQRPGGQGRRVLWWLLPPGAYYAARERARYRPRDPILREGLPPARRGEPRARPWWRLIPPDRLDSASNLLVLAALFALGGLGVGVAWGRLGRREAPTPHPRAPDGKRNA